MDYSVMMSRHPDQRWDLARQMGLDHAVSGMPRDGPGDPWDFEPLLELKNRFADAGFDLDVIEDRPPLDKAILGREGRDEQIETVKTLLRNMGRVGIDVWCYVWMAPLKVLRTSRSVRGRGDSLVTAYRDEQFQRGPDVDGVSAEQLWDSLAYFLDEVVPVAEEAGVKLALHPDDPPHGPIRGADRIITSVENYRRVLDLYDSEANGITLCQGNFAAMGADIPAAIEEFDERIHFVHVRDVEGSADDFEEVWHDEGPTDMGECIRTYEEIGYDGPLRPDHCPTMAGEDNDSPGYHDKGRLWAIGYLQGLRDQYESMSE
jgi:mannonate dehydratase